MTSDEQSKLRKRLEEARLEDKRTSEYYMRENVRQAQLALADSVARRVVTSGTAKE